MNDWITSALGTECSIAIGGTPARNRAEFWDTALQTNNHWAAIRDLNGRFLTTTAERLTDAGVLRSNAKLVPKGSVLLSFKLTLGRTAIAGTDLYTNEAIAALRSESLAHDFLYYGLQSWDLFADVDQAIKGATLNKAKLRRIPIRFPSDATVQNRIAAVVGLADQAIEQTEALLAKRQRIKAGLMHDLLTRGLDAQGRLRDPATHPFKPSALGPIPEAWRVSPLEAKKRRDRAYIKTGPFGTAIKSHDWTETGVPVITIGALGTGRILMSALQFLNEEKAEGLAAYKVAEGDLLFSRVADVGRSIVVTAAEEGWIMSSNLMRISLDQSAVVPAFAHLLLIDDRTAEQTRRSVNAGGREVANTAILKALLFAWPSPDEQSQIAATFAAHEAASDSIQRELEKYRRLKTGLMQDLLTGQVPVTPLLAEPEPANAAA